MDVTSLVASAAAVITALLSYLGGRQMAHLAHRREVARLARLVRNDTAAAEQAAAQADERARGAVLAERNELLARWRVTLDEAREERRRLVEEHRVETARLRQEHRDELAGYRESAQAVIADLRVQNRALRDQLNAEYARRYGRTTHD
ncbi:MULTISPECIES: hypothetical protein [Micromonosporaceae]|uniref:hypothetical protein n=1 Tax=Micromonosporaceae TaxID=28056 RepID=UPI00248BAD6F|nr:MULTISPECIES: hypothetical protein [unclassified Solwaraspora]WBB96105.1 hypothetical protein O7553_22555 [Solwaraspora sp. WMMA2059]WBC19990.1 hypothetical protein O7543_24820 [Solwaraspora sp. WMMA2080]WJK32413.1 hypothetical protein O7610_16680 [Solwaraspora sp. WMMA2065]